MGGGTMEGPGGAAAGQTAAPVRGFQHEAMFHAGDAEFLEGMLAFIGEGLDAREPILVTVRGRRVRLLERELRDCERVLFSDMERVGANPARIIPAWRRFLDEHAPDGRPARGVGEPIWSGRPPAELNECERHERLLNLAFDRDRPFRLLCPYDVSALDGTVIERARACHPYLTRSGHGGPNDAYSPTASAFDGELEPPGSTPYTLDFDKHQLAQVRAFIAEAAYSAALGGARGEDLVVAVNELASNTIAHGGGRGSLLVWMEGDTLLCEVRDGGCIADPLAGRTRPTPEQLAGRGLWLVNNLCDLVQIRSSPDAGTAVRVHMLTV
jgi:anti-sigma regulatory factor (Ser/Thr protein kinase)